MKNPVKLSKYKFSTLYFTALVLVVISIVTLYAQVFVINNFSIAHSLDLTGNQFATNTYNNINPEAGITKDVLSATTSKVKVGLAKTLNCSPQYKGNFSIPGKKYAWCPESCTSNNPNNVPSCTASYGQGKCPPNWKTCQIPCQVGSSGNDFCRNTIGSDFSCVQVPGKGVPQGFGMCYPTKLDGNPIPNDCNNKCNSKTQTCNTKTNKCEQIKQTCYATSGPKEGKKITCNKDQVCGYNDKMDYTCLNHGTAKCGTKKYDTAKGKCVSVIDPNTGNVYDVVAPYGTKYCNYNVDGGTPYGSPLKGTRFCQSPNKCASDCAFLAGGTCATKCEDHGNIGAVCGEGNNCNAGLGCIGPKAIGSKGDEPHTCAPLPGYEGGPCYKNACISKQDVCKNNMCVQK